MELNTSGTNFSFRNYLQEEDPRILAKSYVVYKIGEFNYLSKLVPDGFPSILINYHKLVKLSVYTSGNIPINGNIHDNIISYIHMS